MRGWHMAKQDNYEVGYGKPPKHSQFKPGQSGNLKGRPAGVRNFKTELNEVINSKVTVNRDGRKQSITAKRAVVLKLTEKSLSGSVPAIRTLIELIRTYDEEEIDSAVIDLSTEDAQILERFTEQIRNQAKHEHELNGEGDHE